MEELTLHIEALIFASETPIKASEIQLCLQNTFHISLDRKFVVEHIERLQEKYEKDQHAIHLTQIAGGYQFLTKPAYHDAVNMLLKQRSKKKLSRAALETLSVIAYKQPITKSEVEQIRGVSCDYAIHKLLDKELIAIKGRSLSPGRPLLYSTSIKFMNHFGINSIKDLPKLKEFKEVDNAIGIAKD